MPSPFPGMDPFLEGPRWLNFHNSLCIALRNQLVPQIVPGFVVDVEERLVVEIDDEIDGETAAYRADIGISRESEKERAGISGAVATAEPRLLTYRWIEPRREVILHVLDSRSRRIVTVIEVFSPWNKLAGGRGEYLAKREDLLHSGVNLVEIDLLRGGRRLPTVEPLPQGDQFTFVTRADEKRNLYVYSSRWEEPLPTIPVPLTAETGEASLRLQEALSRVYDEGGFRHLLDYEAPLEPPLSPPDAAWAAEILSRAELARRT